MPKGAVPFPFGKCGVCQAQATGVHYGAVTCEGCKGFFKRSLVKVEKYKCSTDGNCQIEPGNRIKCKLCRFNQCLSLGMSMDAIKMGRIPKVEKQKALEEGITNPDLSFRDNPEAPPDAKQSRQMMSSHSSVQGVTQQTYDHSPDVITNEQMPFQYQSASNTGDPTDDLLMQSLFKTATIVDDTNPPPAPNHNPTGGQGYAHALSSAIPNQSTQWRQSQPQRDSDQHYQTESHQQQQAQIPPVNQQFAVQHNHHQLQMEQLRNEQQQLQIQQERLEQRRLMSLRLQEIENRKKELELLQKMQQKEQAALERELSKPIQLENVSGQQTQRLQLGAFNEQLPIHSAVIGQHHGVQQWQQRQQFTGYHHEQTSTHQGQVQQTAYPAVFTNGSADHSSRQHQQQQQQEQGAMQGSAVPINESSGSPRHQSPQQRLGSVHHHQSEHEQLQQQGPQLQQQKPQYRSQQPQSQTPIQQMDRYVAPDGPQYQSTGSPQTSNYDNYRGTYQWSDSSSSVHSPSLPSASVDTDTSATVVHLNGQHSVDGQSHNRASPNPSEAYSIISVGGVSDNVTSESLSSADYRTASEPASPVIEMDGMEELEALDSEAIITGVAKTYWAVTRSIRDSVTKMEESFETGGVNDKVLRVQESNLPKIWELIMESVNFYNGMMIEFVKGCPGFSAIDPADQTALIRHAYLSVWLIWNAPLFRKGDTFILFLNGVRYPRKWMAKILPEDFVDYLHEYAERQNNARLSIKELAILSALALTPKNSPGLNNLDMTHCLHEKFTAAMHQEITNTRVNPKEIINEIPYLLQHLNTAVARQGIILNFNEKNPPVIKFDDEIDNQPEAWKSSL